MEVVKLLKPDSGGHMARIFSAYAWRSGSVEVLGMPSLPTLVRDLSQYGSGTPQPALNEEDLFLVRALHSPSLTLIPASPPLSRGCGRLPPPLSAAAARPLLPWTNARAHPTTLTHTFPHHPSTGPM